MEPSERFRTSTAPGALQLACFSTAHDAENYFRAAKLPFRPDLLRHSGGRICHVLYTPTVPGFRADPEDAPVSGLLFDVDLLTFLGKSTRDHGDSLDIAKAVLSGTERPLSVTLGVNMVHPRHLYQDALQFHFGNLKHDFKLRNSREDRAAWSQDYVKSGSAAGRPVLMATRQIFEGVNAVPELTESYARASSLPIARSKLSWIGGDLAFVRRPGSGSLILLFGDRSRPYLARDLTRGEYAYVLQLEFGADEVVDLSGIGIDLDYFVSFLPEQKAVLVADADWKDPQFACSAATALMLSLAAAQPAPAAIAELRSAVCTAPAGSVPEMQKLAALREFEEHEQEWVVQSAPRTAPRVEAYVRTSCGADLNCPRRLYLESRGQSTLLREAPELLRDWVDGNMARSEFALSLRAYIAIIETQLETPDPARIWLIREKEQMFAQLGFRIIRVPLLGDSRRLAWRGVSYVNSLLIDRTLFVPRFGLGGPEERVYDILRRALPGETVAPVYARYSLLHAGGVHCRTAILRQSVQKDAKTAMRKDVRPGSGVHLSARADQRSPVPAQQAAPAAGRGQAAAIVSPEVREDHRVAFRINAPKAQAVRLGRGDIPGLGPAEPLSKAENGVWEITVGPLDPGAYRYNFNVDGVLAIDPRNPSTSESNNNVWSLVYVPGSDFMDTKDVPHGAVAEVTYYSKVLSRFRRMHVYTPPGYETGKQKYPVFYLLHGSGDSDDAWTTVGRAGFILDNLIAAKKAKPMLVVMPAGHTRRIMPREGRLAGRTPPRDEFVREFLNDIMPCAESHYRVLASRNNRAIAGLSMGGGHTLSIAIPKLDQFAYIGVYSAGLFAAFPARRDGSGPARPADSGPSWEEQNKAQLDNPALKKGLKLFWFATGVDDFVMPSTRSTVDSFKKHGFTPVFSETSGARTWINWRNYLIEFAPQLFR